MTGERTGYKELLDSEENYKASTKLKAPTLQGRACVTKYREREIHQWSVRGKRVLRLR